MYKEYIDPTYTYKNFTVEEQDKILLAKRSNNTLVRQWSSRVVLTSFGWHESTCFEIRASPYLHLDPAQSVRSGRMYHGW